MSEKSIWTARSGGSLRLGHVRLKDLKFLVRAQLQPRGEVFLNVKGVLGIRVREVLVVGVLGDVVLIREEGAHAAKLQDALAAVHDGKLVLTHQLLAELLVVQAVGALAAPAFSGVEGVDGFLAQRGGQLLQGGRLLTA